MPSHPQNTLQKGKIFRAKILPFWTCGGWIEGSALAEAILLLRLVAEARRPSSEISVREAAAARLRAAAQPGGCRASVGR